MKVEELRVGNWLKDYYTNNPFKIELPDMVLLDRIIKKGQFQTTGFTPIELTEEWLIKFGFDYYESEDIFPTYVKGNINVNDGVVNIVGYPKFLNHIKHIHQLQNLYHSLTGKELEIKG